MEPRKTNLFEDNGKEKNEFGIDKDLEAQIVEKIKADQGKSKYRVCKERPLFVTLNTKEVQFLMDESGKDRETLFKEGKLTHYLYQIQALRDIKTPHKTIKAGEYGGFISSTASLDYLDESWITPEVIVMSGAFVSGNALIEGNIWLTGVINIGEPIHLQSTEQLTIDHHGIYNVDTKKYRLHDVQFSSNEIQEALNRHWIRHEIGRHVVPFNMKAHL